MPLECMAPCEMAYQNDNDNLDGKDDTYEEDDESSQDDEG